MVLYLRSSGAKTRVGFAVGRRVGGAVVRNRARRLLKEAWRTLSPQVLEGFDVVCVGLPAMRGARQGEVREELRELLARGKALSTE